MPIYEYVCQACGQRAEVIHGVHAEAPVACDACGGRLRRAVSVPAIVFKGSGWAKVDARRQPAAKAASDKATVDGSADKPAADNSAPAPTAAPDKGSAPSSTSTAAD